MFKSGCLGSDMNVQVTSGRNQHVSDLRIAVIVGGTRPGRNGKQVADWVFAKAKARTGADYELVDLADFPLPHLDEALPPTLGQYAGEHPKAWAAKIDSYDGF